MATYILGGLVLILTAIQACWDYLLKTVFKDGRTNDHKRLRKQLLVVTLLLLLINQISSVISNYQKDKSSKAESKTLSASLQSLREANQMLTNQISTINSSQQNLSERYQNLVNELATNASINLNLRQRIVDANRTFEVIDSQVVDLNAWQIGLRARLDNRRAAQQIENEKKLEDQQAVYEDNLPYCDYTIKALIELLGRIAAQKGDKVVSDFNGLPKFIPSEVGETNIANIKLQNNADWDFNVTFGGKEWNGRRGLHINGKGGALVIWISVKPSGIETWLDIPGQERLTDSQPVEDYKKIIPAGLANLFAAELEYIAGRKNEYNRRRFLNSQLQLKPALQHAN